MGLKKFCCCFGSGDDENPRLLGGTNATSDTTPSRLRSSKTETCKALARPFQGCRDPWGGSSDFIFLLDAPISYASNTTPSASKLDASVRMIDNLHADITGAPPPLSMALSALPILQESLGIYPPEFFKAIGVHGIILCRELAFRGQKRGHIPCLGKGFLLAECDPRFYALQRRLTSLHHELWHMADYAEFGKMYDREDPGFAAHNPPGFLYDKRGAHFHRANLSNKDSALPEFLNTYSMSSVAEDKAEVWAALIWSPATLSASPGLAAKAVVLKERAARLCAGMGSRWWEGVDRYRTDKEKEYGEALNWEEWPSKDQPGRSFWYHRMTRETTWDRPPVMDALYGPTAPPAPPPLPAAASVSQKTVTTVTVVDRRGDSGAGAGPRVSGGLSQSPPAGGAAPGGARGARISPHGGILRVDSGGRRSPGGLLPVGSGIKRPRPSGGAAASAVAPTPSPMGVGAVELREVGPTAARGAGFGVGPSPSYRSPSGAGSGSGARGWSGQPYGQSGGVPGGLGVSSPRPGSGGGPGSAAGAIAAVSPSLSGPAAHASRQGAAAQVVR